MNKIQLKEGDQLKLISVHLELENLQLKRELLARTLQELDFLIKQAEAEFDAVIKSINESYGVNIPETHSILPDHSGIISKEAEDKE